MKSSSMTIRQFIPMMPFDMFVIIFKVVLAFVPVGEILKSVKRDHSNHGKLQ